MSLLFIWEFIWVINLFIILIVLKHDAVVNLHVCRYLVLTSIYLLIITMLPLIEHTWCLHTPGLNE